MRTTQRTLTPGFGQMAAALRALQVSVLLKTVFRAIKNRRDLNRLQELDDAQLHDVGLTRNDIDRARTSTFFEDPFKDLKQKARLRAGRMERF